jgi:carboxy-terminal domain RNA polymerase II polypeptide A small phosphatase
MDTQQRILLILDLDETLIFSTGNPFPGRPHDFMVCPYSVYCRPHLDDFLRACSQYYDLAVWSSGGSDYVEGIVGKIMHEGVQPVFVWSRERCTARLDPESGDTRFLKDLRKIKRRGYDLDRVLIVEDTRENVRRHYGNAIYVVSYTGQPDDTELLLLGRYLASLHTMENVRRLEKRGWRQASIRRCP